MNFPVFKTKLSNIIVVIKIVAVFLKAKIVVQSLLVKTFFNWS